jgi:hypothetical protein
VTKNMLPQMRISWSRVFLDMHNSSVEIYNTRHRGF